MKASSREAGFTLVEVLVVLVAASLLLVGLSWVLQGTATDLRKARDADAQAIGLDGIMRVRTLVESALPGTADAGGGAVVYLVPPPLALGAAGPLEMELRTVPEGAGQSLVATFRKVGGNPLPAPPVQLLRGCDRIDMGTIDGSVIPLLRLQLWCGKAQWTYVFRPRVNTAATCRFDPISLECRA